MLTGFTQPLAVPCIHVCMQDPNVTLATAAGGPEPARVRFVELTATSDHHQIAMRFAPLGWNC